MAVDATTLIGGALGGAVVQSVLGPIVGQRHERRNLRADVLQRIAEIENRRWEGGDSDDFLRAIHELFGASLVAGLHREPVEFYGLVAAAARQHIETQMDRGEAPEEAGIPLSLSKLVSTSAEMLTAYIWHPHWRRLTLRYELRKLKAQKESATAALNNRRRVLNWDVGLPARVRAG